MKKFHAFGSPKNLRQFNLASARVGFNGKENDNEVKGNGNSVDFGARIFDSRLGRWMSVDKLSNKYAGITPYQFVKNSPIIFVDPDGNTDFYAADGKWIGNDGVNNGMRTIVLEKDIRKEVIKNTKAGLYYTTAFPDKSSFSLPSDQILTEALTVYNKTTRNGGQKEVTEILKKDGENYKVLFEKEGAMQDPRKSTKIVGATESELPEGDVSIHSHPTNPWLFRTGNGVQLFSNDATAPSELNGDWGIFLKYNLNIIVGKEGTLNNVDNYTMNGDTRDAVISVFDKYANLKNTSKISTISTILKGDKGELFKKFTKKQEKNKVDETKK